MALKNDRSIALRLPGVIVAEAEKRAGSANKTMSEVLREAIVVGLEHNVETVIMRPGQRPVVVVSGDQKR